MIQGEKCQPLVNHNYSTYLEMKKVATHEQYSTNPEKIKLLPMTTTEHVTE